MLVKIEEKKGIPVPIVINCFLIILNLLEVLFPQPINDYNNIFGQVVGDPEQIFNPKYNLF